MAQICTYTTHTHMLCLIRLALGGGVGQNGGGLRTPPPLLKSLGFFEIENPVFAPGAKAANKNLGYFKGKMSAPRHRSKFLGKKSKSKKFKGGGLLVVGVRLVGGNFWVPPPPPPLSTQIHTPTL